MRLAKLSSLFLVISIALLGCGVDYGLDLDDIFVTMTPTQGVIAPFPTAIPTEVPLTVTPDWDATPTPLCAGDLIDCIQVGVFATPLGSPLWEYITEGYWKIRCVGEDAVGNAVPCFLRSYPHLGTEHIAQRVEHGTEKDASGFYHCEVYTYCDTEYLDWYFTSDGLWAAGESDVWLDITP